MLAERGAPLREQLLLASVGSDHHPFTRLVLWMDDYVSAVSPRRALRYVCQHGTAPAPRHGEGHRYIDHAELQSLMGRASAVVVQGGPYSMIESVRNGRVPIVVPRRGVLREVVDDHQLAFCRFLAEQNMVLLATTREELHRLLDEVLDDPDAFVAPALPYEEARAAAVERFGAAVSGCRPVRLADLWRVSSAGLRGRAVTARCEVGMWSGPTPSSGHRASTASDRVPAEVRSGHQNGS